MNYSPNIETRECLRAQRRPFHSFRIRMDYVFPVVLHHTHFASNTDSHLLIIASVEFHRPLSSPGAGDRWILDCRHSSSPPSLHTPYLAPYKLNMFTVAVLFSNPIKSGEDSRLKSSFITHRNLPALQQHHRLLLRISGQDHHSQRG